MSKINHEIRLVPDAEGVVSEKQEVCKNILNAALSIVGADFGNIQLLNPDSNCLEILAQHGFNLDFLEYFKSVHVGSDSTACGKAAHDRQRVLVADVETVPEFSKYLQIFRSVPVRAVVSVPLIGRDGALLGVLSTHFSEPRLPADAQIQELDRYISKAVALIERLYADNPEEVNKEQDIDWFLNSIEFFQALPEADRSALYEMSSIKEYAREAAIVGYGNQADRMFVVLNGWVKIYNANREGRESGIMLLTQGDKFGAESIFDGGVHLYSARAETKAQIMELSARQLRQHARKSPSLSEQIMRALADEIKERQLTEVCSRHKAASQRVACLLLRLSAWMNGNGGIFRMPYKKAIAAAQLDMDQATFSRALSGLDNIGVSTRESEILINDFSALSRHCCIDCPFSVGASCKGNRMKQA